MRYEELASIGEAFEVEKLRVEELVSFGEAFEEELEAEPFSEGSEEAVFSA